MSRIAALGLALIVGGSAVEVGAAPVRFSTVVIDAGHGGRDSGSTWNHLVEKRLCLDVAKRVEAGLKSNGLKTVMTRRSDVFVELGKRARIANGIPSSIFVSIHFNGCRHTGIAGAEAYYRSARGKSLASAVSRSIKNRVAGSVRGVFHANYKVLRDTEMPAVLIECGYLSNKREAMRCADPNHRQKLAAAIVSGLLAVRAKP